MARKQKKLTRKQRAQQQEAVARHRQAKGWISPNEKAKLRAELTQDMAPLIPILQSGIESEEDQLFWLLVDSGELAEEPEFKEIFTEPLLTVPIYINVAEEHGIATPDMLDELPEEEREDKKAEMLEEATRRLLSDELHQELIEAVNRLRLRWKRAGKLAEAAKAAAIQMTLIDRKSSAVWPMLGLVQAIVLRSLGAGFEIIGASLDESEIDNADENTMATIYQNLNDPALTEKIDQAIKKVPGLQNFLEKQVDKMWDEGEDAVFMGELNLELFTDEELEAGAEIFKSVMTEKTEEESAAAEDSAETFISKKNKALFDQLSDYLSERFTPERLEQLRGRLKTMLDEATYPPDYFSFLRMVAEAMADEEAAENEKIFLLKAFLGEMRAAAIALEEESDEAFSEDE